GQRGETMCVAWSPDGTMIAAGGTDRTVRLWKSDGMPVTTIDNNEGMIDDVAWAPDSNRLAFTDLWKGVVVAQRDGTIEKTIELRDKSRIHAVDWHPTDGTLAVATHRGILIYTSNFEPKATAEHTRWTRAVKWSPDGSWLVGNGNKVEIMSPDLTVAHTFDPDGWGDIHRVAWSPNSKTFAVSKHPHVRRFTIDGKELPKLKGTDSVDSVAWAPNDDTLFLAGYRFAMFDTSDWSRKMLTQPVAAPTYSLDLKADSSELADGHFSKICVRSLDGRVARTIPHDASHLAWLPATRDVLTMGWPNRLYRVNTDGEETTIYDTGGDDKPYWKMAVSPDGQSIAARVENYGEFSLRLWNQDGTLRKLVPVDQDPRDFDWDWSQARLVVTSGNGIRFFNSQGEPDGDFATNYRPDYVRISPTGNQVATAQSWTNGVCVVDTSGDEQFRTTATPGWGTRRLAWAPDGERIAYSDWGRHEIHVTNMEGRVTHILEGHHCSDAMLQWSRDGRMLITAGRDGMVHARDGRDFAFQWVGLTTRTQQPTWSVNGEMLHGDEDANARELMYLVEDGSGRVQILEQEAFYQRVGRKSVNSANLIENGSFERPWVESGFSNSAKLSLPGWHADDVDVVYSYYDAASGMQSLDMSGGSSGAAWQTVVTTAGQDYELSFYVSVNPHPEGERSMQVSWDGKKLDEITISSKGRTTRKMRWERRQYRVRASSSSTELRFVSLERSGTGVALDDVRLEPMASRP
ncbi:MAG: PD40 domain-containing protein, partial [Planctomycetales bacterium]|nr:PD40 domain-containing protein [Planctomycetales bacterium]